MSEDASMRNRKTPPSSSSFRPPPPPPPPPAAVDKEEGEEAEEGGEEIEMSSGISLLDVIRVLSGVVLLSSVLSWLVTDGESLTWGYKSNALRWNNIKGLFTPPLILTDAELARYDGTDPTLPIYVAVNGSVFDVSAAPQTYGPGGAYSFFSGRDAARAFASGCFKEDLTWDLRGLEEMFITGKEKEEDDKEMAEIERLERDGGMDSRVRYLKKRRDRRRIQAWKQVVKAVGHWEKFFRNHDKYFYVGKVVHPDLTGEPIRKLCDADKKP